MVKKRSFLQRLKEWESNREPIRQRKPKLTEAEEAIIRKKAGLPPNAKITITVGVKQTKAINIKMYNDDLIRLEQVAAIISEGNQSEAIRKALGVIYEDMLDKGLVKAS